VTFENLPPELRKAVAKLPVNLQGLALSLPPYLKLAKACEVRGGCSRSFLYERAAAGKVKFVKSGEAASAPTLIETMSLLADMGAMQPTTIKPRSRKAAAQAGA
jgi:hypothetical protein